MSFAAGPRYQVRKTPHVKRFFAVMALLLAAPSLLTVGAVLFFPCMAVFCGLAILGELD